MTLKFKPNPTFRAKVEIPAAGGESIEIEFTFRHRGKKALDTFAEEIREMPDADALMLMVEDWTDMGAPFGADALAELLDDYPAAAFAITRAYFRELLQARLGN